MALLGAVGLTLILVRGGVAAPLRRLWPALFGCAMCVGFWVGDFVSVAQHRPDSWAEIVSLVLFAGAVSTCAMTLDFVHAWLDARTGS